MFVDGDFSSLLAAADGDEVDKLLVEGEGGRGSIMASMRKFSLEFLCFVAAAASSVALPVVADFALERTRI